MCKSDSESSLSSLDLLEGAEVGSVFIYFAHITQGLVRELFAVLQKLDLVHLAAVAPISTFYNNDVIKDLNL